MDTSICMADPLCCSLETLTTLLIGNVVVTTSLVAQMIKSLPAKQETQVQTLGWEDLLEKGMAYPLQYSCLENPHGQNSLVGYSPWDHRVTHD